MSSNTEEDGTKVASSSNLKEIKTEADIGLIKKEVDEEELKNNQNDLRELLAEGSLKTEKIQIEDSIKEEIDFKVEEMSNESEAEELLIEFEPKSESPEILQVEASSEEDFDVKEVLNSDVQAKSRFIRHDSIDIKEECISDEDVNIEEGNLKRQHSSEVEAGSEVLETKKKRIWNYNLEKRRQGEGEYHRLCAELSMNEQRYYTYFHMSHEAFEELHDKLSPNITKMYSNFRTPITSRERLVVCLRYIASGASYGKMAASFQLGRSTVSKIVRETCQEIWTVLRPEYMPEPTRRIWEESERGYSDIYNFPNCVGCIDGKHVSIKYPPLCKRGDNYDKKQSSVVLLSVIDPWCKFTVIDIGDYGYPKETGIFEETEFYHTYIESLRKVLPSKTLPGTTSIVPRVFIGDETFVLQPFMLRPYPVYTTKSDEKKKKYNEKLKEPRTVVKEAFDMFTKNWKLFAQPLETDLDTAISVIRAACCLHNYVIKQGVGEEEDEALPEESQPKRLGRRKKPKKTFVSHNLLNRRWTTEAGRVREMFASYFNK